MGTQFERKQARPKGKLDSYLKQASSSDVTNSPIQLPNITVPHGAGVIIKAPGGGAGSNSRPANTDVIEVGSDTTTEWQIEPGNSVGSFDIENLNQIYVTFYSAGDHIEIIYVNDA